jgi:transposase
MEGLNGYGRPLDRMVQEKGYQLYNVNNLKLARFKEIFPGAAKTDRLDTRKILELFHLKDHLPLAKDAFQEVPRVRPENEHLKRLSRSMRAVRSDSTAGFLTIAGTGGTSAATTSAAA